MSVEAILQHITTLTPAERADLLARLRLRYDDDGNEAAEHPMKTGIYTIDQLIDRARRSS